MRPKVSALVLLCTSLVAVQTAVAGQKASFRQIRYMGGTLGVKASSFDYNTTVTFSENDTISITVAPVRAFTPIPTVRLKPADIESLSFGAAAWKRVADVPGAHLSAKRPQLFGLIQERRWAGIVYRTDQGRGAVLLDAPGSGLLLLMMLSDLSGKAVER